MLDSENSNLDITSYDSEIIVLFLDLVRCYQDKKLDDFLLEKAKVSAVSTDLYNSLLEIHRTILQYAK